MVATLSLAMIVKNEEETIERILSCAQGFCDELIVVDTGSTDKTVALAEAMGAKVHYFQWIDDFGAARNFAFSKATSDWIIWLDADDIVTEDDQAKIRELKATQLNDDIDGVFMTYQIQFTPEGECTFSYHRERIMRRAANLKWEGRIHECIALPVGRNLVRGDINIQHWPLSTKLAGKVNRNINILEQCIKDGDRSPRTLFYYANELRDHQRFEEACPIYQEYIGISNVGWEKHAAMMSLARCYFSLNNEEKALYWCTQAMLFDSERAEAFNLIGIHFYNKQQWTQAIPFFMAALALKKPDTGFVSDSDYTWVPYDYLSICYDRLGDRKKSIELTLNALSNNPDKPRLIKNLHWLVDQL